MIYHYGLRVDEATAITVEDVALTHPRLRIRQLTHGMGGEMPPWRHTANL
jgi:integrase